MYAKTRAERRQGRADTLSALEKREDGGYQRALAALERVHTQGRGRQTIDVRSGFYEVSLDAVAKPPASQLVTPRGYALRMALLVLFVAQNNSGSAHHVLNVNLAASTSDEVAWADLVMTAAEKGAGSTSKRVQKKRADSARAALKRLAQPDVALLELPDSEKRKGAYDRVRLLEDVGPREFGAAVQYTVPVLGPDVITVPVDFFLKGWVYMLEDTEILTYLMYRSLCAKVTPAHINADNRYRRFGIGQSAWEQYKVLEDSGIIKVEHAESRRDDGTVIGQASGAELEPHHFSLEDDGLAQAALPAVRDALQTNSH